VSQQRQSLGTLRVEGKESQIRYEQSRWKIGTAAARRKEKAVGGGSTVGGDCTVRTEATAVAKACNSFWEFERGKTGTLRLSAGFAQHAGVAQCLESQPVQQHLGFAPRVFGAPPADIVKTPCHARINPSRKTTAVFTGRNNMASTWSHRTTNPYASCQNPER